MFSCHPVLMGRGVPHPVLPGVSTPIQSYWGYPHPVLLGGGYPHLVPTGGGLPPSSLNWGGGGTPHPVPTKRAPQGTSPVSLMGYPHQEGWGYHPAGKDGGTPIGKERGTPVWDLAGVTPPPPPVVDRETFPSMNITFLRTRAITTE